MLTLAARIGVKPIRSNALLLAQKKNGRAVINEDSLKHFEDKKPSVKQEGSPRKSQHPQAPRARKRLQRGMQRTRTVVMRPRSWTNSR